MLYTVGAACSRFARHFVPNPFIFAILLTVLTAVLAVTLTPTSPLDAVVDWYEGFWGLLSFSMQMVVILLFGYVLASSAPVRRVIEKLAKIPKSASQAIIMITLISIAFGYLSWGLGLIVGAISARVFCEEGLKRGIKIHYPLAAAAGFSALITFNNGLSASAPLLSNTGGHFLHDTIGLIPTTQTIFTSYNIITLLAFALIIPFVYAAMHPKDKGLQTIEVSHATTPEPSLVTQHVEKTLATRLENARILSWIIVLAGFTYVIYHFATRGFDLNLNLVNFMLLICGMAAYGSPIAYVKAVDEAVSACGQVVLQFPFYAGIMGIMAGSGLVTLFADAMVSISNAYTYPFFAFISSAIINIAIPSAGGQWAVQGPSLVEAAQRLGVDIGQTIMAYSYGDQLTNGIQPMWMLPLLGVTKLKVGDVLGYTAVMMLIAFVIFAVGIAVLPVILPF